MRKVLEIKASNFSQSGISINSIKVMAMLVGICICRVSFQAQYSPAEAIKTWEVQSIVIVFPSEPSFYE